MLSTRLRRFPDVRLAAKAVEYMIVDALVEAEPVMKIAGRLEDPKKYLHLTDHIQTEIEASEDPVCALSPSDPAVLQTYAAFVIASCPSSSDSASDTCSGPVQGRRFQDIPVGVPQPT